MADKEMLRHKPRKPPHVPLAQSRIDVVPVPLRNSNRPTDDTKSGGYQPIEEDRSRRFKYILAGAGLLAFIGIFTVSLVVSAGVWNQQNILSGGSGVSPTPLNVERSSPPTSVERSNTTPQPTTSAPTTTQTPSTNTASPTPQPTATSTTTTTIAPTTTTQPPPSSEAATAPPPTSTTTALPTQLTTRPPPEKGANVPLGCEYAPAPFTPLGNFSFWGKTMNFTFPCPTAGMNNQIMLFMGMMHCFLASKDANFTMELPSTTPTYQQRLHVFNWKEITCSPTGGKDGQARYVVGAQAYFYSWFRWSEMFEYEPIRVVTRIVQPSSGAAASGARAAPFREVRVIGPDVRVFPPGMDPWNWDVETQRANADQRWSELTNSSENNATTYVDTFRVCLSPTYTWKEHPSWMTNCAANVDRIWGSHRYWAIRHALRLKPWFDAATIHILRHLGVIEPTLAEKHIERTLSEAPRSSSTGAPQQTEDPFAVAFPPPASAVFPFIAIHVRRGDYINFCKETRRSSGKYKYLTPPYKSLFRQHPNTSTLYADFMDVCYPSMRHIVNGVAQVLGEMAAQEGKTIETGTVQHVLLATNSQTFRSEFKAAMANDTRTERLHVVWFNVSDAPLSSDEYYTTHAQDTASTSTPSQASISDPPSFWPRPFYTDTDLAFLDTNLMSMASALILNRYSTFGQSALDAHILRERGIKCRVVFW